MSIQVEQVEYRHGDVVLEAHVAWDEAESGPRPGVLVSHAWGGRGEFEDRKAERLAELGYVGFALDMYGKGVRGGSPEENEALMTPLVSDRVLLQERINLALDQLRGLPNVDAEKTAAIGFCFGGLCVLDLARSGADVRGIVSFHGLLHAPGNTAGNTMNAKALLLHGWQDPLATPENVLAFSEEMAAMKADWQLNAFGNAMHAFTNPAAADPDNGMLYDPVVERRAWDSMWMFLNEVFA